MLQFIVLGQIPGTHIQLTFSWFSLIILAAILIAAHKFYKQHTQRQIQQLQRHFDVISLSSLDQA